MALIELIGSGIDQISLRSVLTTGLVLIFLHIFNLQFSPSRSLPVINSRKLFEFSDANAKKRYRTNAKELLELGFQKSKAFYLNSDSGLILVLANQYAHEIYNSPHLSVSKGVGAELHCDIPGMEGFKDDYFPDHFGLSVIKKHFGRSLELESQLPPVSLGTSSFLDKYWTNNPEWHRFTLNGLVTKMVAQLTSKVQSGEVLSEMPEWHRVCIEFPIQIYIAAMDLDKWPKLLHHVIHWLLPSWKKLRADIATARAIYTPVAEARRAAKHEAVANGQEALVYSDLIEWFEQGAKGRPFDAPMAQLVTAQAMISVSADVITQIIFDICERPLLAQELRAEVLSVIGEEGLTRASLSNLHLMDSVAKESLRMKLLFSGMLLFYLRLSSAFLAQDKVSLSMMTDLLQAGVRRVAEQPITLSDGVVIPKGSLVAIAMENMWDESKYSNPLEFQSDRYLQRRQLPGQEVAAKLTSVTVDHMGFGFGRHSCPGRFYVSSLIKVVLCHILLKYDMRLVGERPAVLMHGLNTVANPTAAIEVRRRQEEIIL